MESWLLNPAIQQQLSAQQHINLMSKPEEMKYRKKLRKEHENNYAVQILNQWDRENPHWDTWKEFTNKEKAEKFRRKLDKEHAFDTFRVTKLKKVI